MIRLVSTVAVLAAAAGGCTMFDKGARSDVELVDGGTCANSDGYWILLHNKSRERGILASVRTSASVPAVDLVDGQGKAYKYSYPVDQLVQLAPGERQAVGCSEWLEPRIKQDFAIRSAQYVPKEKQLRLPATRASDVAYFATRPDRGNPVCRGADGVFLVNADPRRTLVARVGDVTPEKAVSVPPQGFEPVGCSKAFGHSFTMKIWDAHLEEQSAR